MCDIAAKIPRSAAAQPNIASLNCISRERRAVSNIQALRSSFQAQREPPNAGIEWRAERLNNNASLADKSDVGGASIPMTCSAARDRTHPMLADYFARNNSTCITPREEYHEARRRRRDK